MKKMKSEKGVKFGKTLLFVALFAILVSLNIGTASAGIVYQDFEGSGKCGWNGSAIVRPSIPEEPVHSGKYSFRADSLQQWNYFYVRAKSGGWSTDFLQENNDRLIFWIYSLPQQEGTDNAVGVNFYDSGNYSSNGFDVWTTFVARYEEWTKLTILFDQLPPNLDLRHINKLEFKNYWPGTYYIDDIQAVREDRFYQSFEPDKGGVTDPEEFGWCWGGACSLSEAGEQVYEGQHSWKIVLNEYWAGTGIKSEHEYYVNGQQLFWHTDLDPEVNDQLSFWVYALPLNGLDNNVNIQFYDHDAHRNDTTKVEYWTNKAARYKEWTQITVPFSALIEKAPDLNLTDIDKIQFQMYWPGAYYLDKIEATSSVPTWNRSSLRDGTLKWESNLSLNQYRLEENTHTGDPKDTNWATVYVGTGTSFTIPRISQVWYRVRAEEVAGVNNEVPFVSAWSEVLAYNAPAVVINKSKLVQELKLEWTQLAQATLYDVERASNPAGPWTRIHTGPYPAEPLPTSENTWYRICALNGTEKSAWSPAQWKPNPVEQDFLRADGTTIRKGYGDRVTLRGVNLGGYFIIEPWMTDWSAVNPDLDDDYSIREVLNTKCTEVGGDELLQIYRDAFLTDADFDILMRVGVSLVRLPIYYRDLQYENGSLIPNGFEKVDWVVNTCADRGMYVLLDLHGAPGSQSNESHTGRKNFNKLFEDSSDGRKYQDHTVELWKAIATHYKNSTTVMGYDLLNEPVGAPEPEKLWNLYDLLYQAVRDIDPDHIIVMEGIWDWDTLPKPSEKGWENVVYQFHYYLPEEMANHSYLENVHNGNLTSYLQAHKDFIDEKIAMTDLYQNVEQYQVPVMVGEFNGFRARENWEYYLSKFNEQGWSWTLWSYKVSQPNSEWGLHTNHRYDKEDLPQFRSDTCEDIAQKLTRYDTLSRYVPNYCIIAIMKKYLKEGIFDTGPPGNPYPSIMGTHTGTITANKTIIVHKMYTYPCTGIGGHTEYVRFYGNGLNVTKTWNGYIGNYHNIFFDLPFTLEANTPYNYEIRTGSYPQIIHEQSLPTANGTINCTQFTDANGEIYYDWILAIRLE